MSNLPVLVDDQLQDLGMTLDSVLSKVVEDNFYFEAGSVGDSSFVISSKNDKIENYFNLTFNVPIKQDSVGFCNYQRICDFVNREFNTEIPIKESDFVNLWFDGNSKTLAHVDGFKFFYNYSKGQSTELEFKVIENYDVEKHEPGKVHRSHLTLSSRVQDVMLAWATSAVGVASIYFGAPLIVSGLCVAAAGISLYNAASWGSRDGMIDCIIYNSDLSLLPKLFNVADSVEKDQLHVDGESELYHEAGRLKKIFKDRMSFACELLSVRGPSLVVSYDSTYLKKCVSLKDDLVDVLNGDYVS